MEDYGIKREELFISTKLWNDHRGYDLVMKANTPGIFHKRNLLCIGNAERFIFCNLLMKSRGMPDHFSFTGKTVLLD